MNSAFPLDFGISISLQKTGLKDQILFNYYYSKTRLIRLTGIMHSNQAHKTILLRKLMLLHTTAHFKCQFNLRDFSNTRGLALLREMIASTS